MIKGFRHRDYDVFPAGQRLRNEDASPGQWMALACVIRGRGDEVLGVPVSWYQPGFDTEQAAVTYAADSAREMIDAGRCNI